MKYARSGSYNAGTAAAASTAYNATRGGAGSTYENPKSTPAGGGYSGYQSSYNRGGTTTTGGWGAKSPSPTTRYGGMLWSLFDVFFYHQVICRQELPCQSSHSPGYRRRYTLVYRVSSWGANLVLGVCGVPVPRPMRARIPMLLLAGFLRLDLLMSLYCEQHTHSSIHRAIHASSHSPDTSFRIRTWPNHHHHRITRSSPSTARTTTTGYSYNRSPATTRAYDTDYSSSGGTSSYGGGSSYSRGGGGYSTYDNTDDYSRPSAYVRLGVCVRGRVSVVLCARLHRSLCRFRSMRERRLAFAPVTFHKPFAYARTIIAGTFRSFVFYRPQSLSLKDPTGTMMTSPTAHSPALSPTRLPQHRSGGGQYGLYDKYYDDAGDTGGEQEYDYETGKWVPKGTATDSLSVPRYVLQQFVP